MVALTLSELLPQVAPRSFNFSIPNDESSMLIGPESSSPTNTSRYSSSNDQEFAWATHCLVAVINASGLNSPPSHTVWDLREPTPPPDANTF